MNHWDEVSDSGPVADPPVEDHSERAIFGVERPSPERTLIDVLRATIAAHPDAVAVESGTRAITYGELGQVLGEQARRLAELGVGRGARVGIRVPSGTTDLYIAILSALWAGAAYVPVDWDDPDSRAATVWEEADVDVVYGANLSLTAMKVQEPVSPADQSPTLTDDAWIIFTSGSTGKPKGVAITHRSAAAWIDAEARMYLQDAPMGAQDRVMAGLSVAFDASCEEMWVAWRHGATLVAAERGVVKSGDALGEWIINNRISVVSTVPTLASFWPEEALGNVRLLIFGGEACPLDLVVRLQAPGREIWNTYGPTETTVIVTGQLMTPDPPVRIGRPIPGWEAVVVDADGQPVAWGESGELIVGGVGLGRYLDPAKDEQVYAPLPSMGWERAYRTGDLVQAEREGLIFQGRADDQIKFAGRRLELGEIDDHLTRLSDVRVGAAALHKTPAGSDVLVGYLVAEPGADIDLATVRERLGRTLPGGIVPSLCVLDEMPMKTSGKVDRKALPWPLPAGSTPDAGSDLPAELTWLADRWADQLGPVPLSPESDFFDLGGSSVAIAKLVVELRKKYTGADIAELYNNRTLEKMAAYLDTLDTETVSRRMPSPIPWYAGPFQFATVLGLYVINGLRYVSGALLTLWVLKEVFNAGWVPQPPLIPVLISWFILFSTPGKLAMTALIVRTLTAGLRPGTYLRGGPTHLRVWAAERVVTFQRFDAMLGSPLMPLFFRLLGNKVGSHAHLHSFPSVTGLVTIGNNVSVEGEVDLHGYWIEGDQFRVGTIDIEDNVRLGTRSVVSLNTTVHTGAEILPGSHVEGVVRGHQLWGGSPLRHWGDAGQAWPVENPRTVSGVHRLDGFTYRALHLLGLGWITVLPLIAALPGGLFVFERVRVIQMYEYVFPILVVWVPVFVLLTVVTWLSLVIVTVRLLSTMIKPGYYPDRSATAWAVWLTQTLMERTLTSTYFVYASSFTPVFMRLLGAKVGKDTEISTVVTIPHLTWIEDRTFLADHALASTARYRAGWVHVGTTVIGEGSFVGNSAIVGPDRDLPPDSLVAVLSSTPYRAERGTSWLGRKPVSIPRKKLNADSSATYNPGAKLKVARAVVEFLRLTPAVLAGWLDLAIIYVGTMIYMQGFLYGEPMLGLLAVILLSGPVVLLAGITASIIPIIAKWLLVGRFTAGERTLFSTFVWRSELADNFVEPLAVPSLLRMSLGSPMFNLWARLMGAKIGRDVWCETWWLPEFDLITLQDRCTVNRGTVVQTHLFHDRVMSLEHVTIGRGATLGTNSFVLPGASLGDRSTVGPVSLVLRQDQIPSDSVWAGNPVSQVKQNRPRTAIVPNDPNNPNNTEKAVSVR